MSIIIFIAVLALIIFVHELGHFLVAKWSGIRVDEFGIGFPPRIASFKPKKSETTYSLNLLPFGGFVKIFGEEMPTDEEKEKMTVEDKKCSFVYKSRYTQIGVLIAGVFFNWLLAWFLLSTSFAVGLPMVVDEPTENSKVTIVSVVPDSPADEAGLKVGDELVSLSVERDRLEGELLGVESAQEFIVNQYEKEINIEYTREGENGFVEIEPKLNIFESNSYPAIGVSLGFVGVVQSGLLESIWDGFELSLSLTKATAIGLGEFIYDAVVGDADFSQVAGPVGIVGLVGDAAKLGLIQLFVFVAFISINLAIINLIPFPALDGGRILFVIIEGIKGSPIKASVANALNTVGFVLLIILMLVITFNDILRLF